MAVLVTGGGWAFTASPAAAQSAAEMSDEWKFLADTNSERAAAGLSELQMAAAVVPGARDHSATQARENRLWHTELRDSIAPDVPCWTRLGENVGYGGSEAIVHAALMASPEHRANLLGDFNVVGIGVVHSDERTWVTQQFAKTTCAVAIQGPDSASRCGDDTRPVVTKDPASGGYWVLGDNGAVHSFGGAAFHGSLANQQLSQPIVDMATTPSGNGYWLVAADGGVFSFGDARFFGSAGSVKLNQSIVGISSTVSGNGYWLVARDGGIFSFGDALFLGSTGSVRLNQPIVGMTSAPGGGGYNLVAADGGIFSFGTARFYGSTGASKLNQPIAGMATTPSGNGYWLVAADGGIFSFGGAVFRGAVSDIGLCAPARSVSITSTRSGAGYWVQTVAGNMFAFGDATDHGDPQRTGAALVGVSAARS